MAIPTGTKFLGVSKTYPTEEKKSALRNSDSEYYSIDDIAASALPEYVETNDTDRTIWCNGTGNIDSNTVFGDGVLIGNSTGEGNTAIGKDSMEFNSTGSDNTAIGVASLGSNISGGFNTAVGKAALFANTSGLSNTAVGSSALESNTTGQGNVSIGQGCLSLMDSGSYNTAVGNQVSGIATTGDFNSVFGYRANHGGFDGSVVLGVEATATGNNQFVVGSVSQNAGTVSTESNTSTQVWNVKINGVDYKILLA
jgi:hypothetical protein